MIGAGFASGQEVVQFFVKYGEQGFQGVLIASLLFILLAVVLQQSAHRNSLSNYQELLQLIFRGQGGDIVDFVISVFLFFGISIMLSASGAVFSEHLNLPKSMGVMCTYVAVLCALIRGKKGLIKSYAYLVPFKIGFLLLINLCLILRAEPYETSTCILAGEQIGGFIWPLAALLYVAYNFILAMVILVEYQTISAYKDSMLGAVWGGIMLGTILILSYCALTKGIPQVLKCEVPMLHEVGKIGMAAKYCYIIVLWAGILTTAIANTYGFTQRMAVYTGMSFRSILILTLILALPLSWLSFSRLVGVIYPLFGIVGIIIINALIYQYIKDFSG